MSDWWMLRGSPALIDVEWGETDGTLHATAFKLHRDAPVTLAMDLECNLRARKGIGHRVDAEALASGEIKGLKLVRWHDEYVLARLRHHLKHTREKTPPWRLVVTLKGTHEFTVEPEASNHELILRVVGARQGRT